MSFQGRRHKPSRLSASIPQTWKVSFCIHSAHRDVSCADDVRFGAAVGTGCPVPGHLRELCLCVTCDTSCVGDHWNRILPQSPHVVQQLCLAAQTTACLLIFRAEFCLVSLALPPKYSGYRTARVLPQILFSCCPSHWEAGVCVFGFGKLQLSVPGPELGAGVRCSASGWEDLVVWIHVLGVSRDLPLFFLRELL